MTQEVEALGLSSAAIGLTQEINTIEAEFVI